MLVTQQVGRLPTKRILVISGKAVSPRQTGSQTSPGPVPPAASPAGGIVVFSRFLLDRPPGWGACPGGGVLHSRAVATVARWQQPGHADGEGWPPHAVKGPGDDETPGSQPSGWSLRQRAKLQPAPPERGEKMLEECGPTRGGPYRRMRTRGAPGPMTAPDLPTLPAPAAGDRHGGARHQGPYHASAAPTSSAWRGPRKWKNTPLQKGGPPGAARRWPPGPASTKERTQEAGVGPGLRSKQRERGKDRG